jgi:hypothetical protein
MSTSPQTTVVELRAHVNIAELAALANNANLQSRVARIQNEFHAVIHHFTATSNQQQRSTYASSLSESLSASEVYQKCRDEDRCFKYKEKSHIAKGCSKQLRLNW